VEISLDERFCNPKGVRYRAALRPDLVPVLFFLRFSSYPCSPSVLSSPSVPEVCPENPSGFADARPLLKIDLRSGKGENPPASTHNDTPARRRVSSSRIAPSKMLPEWILSRHLKPSYIFKLTLPWQVFISEPHSRSYLCILRNKN
jgi:hypothetical protein